MGLGIEAIILLGFLGLILWLMFLVALAGTLLGIQALLQHLLPPRYRDRRFTGFIAAILLSFALSVTYVVKREYDQLAYETAKIQLSRLCSTLAQPVIRGTVPKQIDVISIKGFRDPLRAAIVLKSFSREQRLITTSTEYEATPNSFGDAMRLEPDLGSKGQKYLMGPARAKYQLEQVKGKDSIKLDDLAGFKPNRLSLRDNHGFLLRDLANNQIVAQRHFPVVVLAVREYSEECKGPKEHGSAEQPAVRLRSFVTAL